MSENKELKGLGGWLILLGLGVIAGPLLLSFQLYQTYVEIMKPDIASFIQSNSPFYNPKIYVYIVSEFVANSLLILASLYAIYLFFSKHYRFPKFYSTLLIAYLLILFLDSAVSKLLFPNIEAFDAETVKDLGKAAIRSLIWVAYLYKSERVKNTFVEKKPIQQEA